MGGDAGAAVGLADVDHDLGLTRRVDDEIIPDLTGIEGVAEVVVFGDRERVLRVEVSPERLAAFGLSVAQVANVLRGARCGRDVAEVRPRYDRDTAEIRPRYGRGTTEV